MNVRMFASALVLAAACASPLSVSAQSDRPATPAENAEMHVLVSTCKTEITSKLQSTEEKYHKDHPDKEMLYILRDDEGHQYQVSRDDFLKQVTLDCALQRAESDPKLQDFLHPLPMPEKTEL